MLFEATCNRIVECGTKSLSDVELISIVLRPGTTGCPHERAAELLVRFGSLRTAHGRPQRTAHRGREW